MPSPLLLKRPSHVEDRLPPPDDALASRLEATGEYRIARRLRPQPGLPIVLGPGLSLGAFVDVETTGLDPQVDEVIELAVLPFTFTKQGDVVAVHPPFFGLRQPSRPIPPTVVELTGIDDGMVRSASIAPDALTRHLDGVSLVVAHNASFDRAFLERGFPHFRDLPWACSLADVPWAAEGIRRTGLEALAAAFGFFYDAHRAIDDCRAAVEILARRLPRSGATVMGAMLVNARKPSFRVWPVGAPYGGRIALKGRGYRWHDGTCGGPRSWYRDVPAESVETERSFLDEVVFGRRAHVPVVRLDAYDRYSERSLRVPDAR